MIDYVLHDKAGRIHQTGTAPAFMIELQGGPGLTRVEGLGDRERDYVKDGKIVPRPANPAELGGNVLIGMPMPCTIHINRSSYACNEPLAELDLPYPGTYAIRVEAFPYLDAVFTLEKS